MATNVEERRAAARFEQARHDGPLALHAFLEPMPKGADLHMHLSGAVYAETFLKEAAEDRLCVDTVKLALVKGERGDVPGADRSSGSRRVQGPEAV